LDSKEPMPPSHAALVAEVARLRAALRGIADLANDTGQETVRNLALAALNAF
jgi:hypothetical protein